jgi:hypothetical protein
MLETKSARVTQLENLLASNSISIPEDKGVPHHNVSLYPINIFNINYKNQ